MLILQIYLKVFTIKNSFIFINSTIKFISKIILYYFAVICVPIWLNSNLYKHTSFIIVLVIYIPIWLNSNDDTKKPRERANIFTFQYG